MLYLQEDLVSMTADVCLTYLLMYLCVDNLMQQTWSFSALSIEIKIIVCVCSVRVRERRGSAWRLRGRNRKI